MPFEYKQVKASEIAEYLRTEYHGDPEVEVSGVNSLEFADKNDMSFVLDKRNIDKAARSKAGLLIVSSKWAGGVLKGRNLLYSDNPKLTMAKAHRFLLKKKEKFSGISERAFVADSAKIAEVVEIHPFAVIGENTVISKKAVIYPNVSIGDNVTIGEGTVIHSGCSIYSDTVIGKNCVIHSGSVIGADGFGFVKDGLRNVKVSQVGSVEIGDDCEIGANNTIDRATFSKTVIGNNVKTDNLVHIAHNCEIGDHSMIVACSGLAGSTVFGKNVIMAGSSGVIDHITIGDHSMIGTHSIVTKDMPSGQIWSGYPAVDHKRWLKSTLLVQKLPELVRRIKELEAKLLKKE
jgi:UDP-3-O-[3-hydroxymyristoyl] glucosamine N-acyltransferase